MDKNSPIFETENTQNAPRRKTLRAIALLLLLAVGVWVNTLRPAPNVKAREATGELKIVDTSEGSFAYRRAGSRPCLVLLPIAGREGSDFNELVTELTSKGYQTITIDAGGTGQSALGLAEDFYNAAYTIEIINAKECGYQQPMILLGHAYGNRVVRSHTSQSKTFNSFDVGLLDIPTQAANITAVILLAAGGQVPPEPEANAALKRIFNPLKSYRSRMKDVQYAFFAEGNDIPPHWKRGWHSKTAIAQGKAKGDGDDSWHCAGGVPMLIVQPMQDKIAPPANAYALKEKCPQEVDIVEIQNAGHALLPEQPEAVAKAVLDFLAKHHPADKKN